MFFFVVLVALVKWPSLVRQALSQLEEMGLDPRTATAGDWRGYMVLLCSLADGRPMTDELKSISPGRTAAIYGLIWVAKHWGIVQKVPHGSEPSHGLRVFVLGCSRKRYELLPSAVGIAGAQKAMGIVSAAPLQFPASSQVTVAVLQRFCAAVGELCRQIGGAQSTLRVGTLARRLLSIAEKRCGPGVWDSCTTEALADVLPDVKDRAHCLRTWTAGDARRRFAMSPLVVSAIACLWGEAPTDVRKTALRADNLSVLRAAEVAGEEHAQPKDWAVRL